MNRPGGGETDSLLVPDGAFAPHEDDDGERGGGGDGEDAVEVGREGVGEGERMTLNGDA